MLARSVPTLLLVDLQPPFITGEEYQVKNILDFIQDPSRQYFNKIVLEFEGNAPTFPFLLQKLGQYRVVYKSKQSGAHEVDEYLTKAPYSNKRKHHIDVIGCYEEYCVKQTENGLKELGYDVRSHKHCLISYDSHLKQKNEKYGSRSYYSDWKRFFKDGINSGEVI